MKQRAESSEVPPTGFITLLAAMAKAGPKVVAAWNGEELTRSIWEPNPNVRQVLAQDRWGELTDWFCENNEVVPLFQLDEDGGASKVPRVAGNASRLFLSGKLIHLNFTETLEKLGSSDSLLDGPQLLVQEAALEAAMDGYVRPVTSAEWSFAEASLGFFGGDMTKCETTKAAFLARCARMR